MLKLKFHYCVHLFPRASSLEKSLMLGKTEGWRRRGWQRMSWLDGIITESMDMSLSKLQEMMKDREAWHAEVHRVTKNQAWLHDWTTTYRNWFGVVFVQSLSHIQLFATPWTAACQAFLSCTISWSLLKLRSIEPMMPSKHLTLCHSLLLLPSVFLSIMVFSSESPFRIRWPEYWSFSISPSNEYSWLISFRIDWFDFLVVQGTLKSLLQHHRSKHKFFSS